MPAGHYDLESDQQHDFTLAKLADNIKRLGFLAGYQTQSYKEEDEANIKAAERMGKLYDRLREIGYTDHPLQVFLVRLMFCMFAEDTGIFAKNLFTDFIKVHTKEDGSDLASKLAEIFQILNTPHEKRLKNVDETLAEFPYVNGKLYEESLPIAAFDRQMREALLQCCGVNWGRVSPAIFGAMFQSVMDEQARRALGAHYTSEKNILKLIGPLFMDDLRAEFERVKSNRNKLFEFHKRLRTLTFFDPACGCGNFLVVAYRELRLLELDVLRSVLKSGQMHLDVHSVINVDVDQFYGIEIEEFPSQIAQVALWMVDHQMNMKVSDEFGMYFARIPLKTTPHIVYGNALRLDWSDVVAAERCNYLFGNPPFVGKQFQSAEQKDDLAFVYGDAKGAKELDLVAAWYVKAARFITDTTRCALVSTNSITQGEQVGLLWSHLKPHGVQIHFAHRTFRWNNEAKGVAAVHCVIIGFGKQNVSTKHIYDYPDINGEPHAIEAKQINAYLVDGPDLWLESRRQPICGVPPIVFGSMPNDGGHLLMDDDEKAALLAHEPDAAKWVHQIMGAAEFLNGIPRWCLWLKDIKPDELAKLPGVQKRVAAVHEYRLASKREATRKLAAFPTLFAEIRQPTSDYLMVPKVSSERRRFIPIGFQHADLISSDLCLVVPGATLFHFGVMSSTMHMAWVRTVCGRLKSDYRYTNEIVYNNFPWPVDANEKQKQAIADAAQEVLDARAKFTESTLAELYDPLTMPPDLVRAHQALDRAVDGAYVMSGGKKTWLSDADRVAFLLEAYQKLTSLLPAAKPKKVRKKAA